MKFSIIHPTARVEPMGSFPRGWLGACSQWAATCAHPEDVEYVVVVDKPQLQKFWAYLSCAPAAFAPQMWGRFTVVTNHGRECWVDATNAGLLAATGEILINNSDDMLAPQDWDVKLSALCPDTSERVALHCLTGVSRDSEVFFLQVLTKALSDWIGPLSPEYISMYADNDWTESMRKHGRVVETGLEFRHIHPVHMTAESDEVYERENSRNAYMEGNQTFAARRIMGFPRVKLPGFPEVKTNEPGFFKKAARELGSLLNSPAPAPLPQRKVALCLPNENAEWLSALLGVINVFNTRGITAHAKLAYNGTGPHATRINLVDMVLAEHRGDPFMPYVLWLDDDNIVTPEIIRRWISFLDAHPEADIVVGWCWVNWGVEWHPSVGGFNEDESNVWMTLGDVYEGGPAIRHVPNLSSGFPCVMMRREVLERLGATAFWLIPSDKHRYGAIPEDLAFFWRAKQAKLRCYLDPMARVGHLKKGLQEPTILYDNADTKLREMIDRVNGKPVQVPTEYHVNL